MPKTETKPIFFPAISSQSSTVYGFTNKTIKNLSINIAKDLRFYSKLDNYFYYPYVLFNAHEHLLTYGIKKNELHKKRHIDKKCLVFVDSGGYQLGKGAKENPKYNAKIVLPWCESNGDIFPIIDYPLFSPYKRTYKESLDFTIKNGEYYKKHRKKKGVKILNVLQGRDFDEIDEWYESIKHLNKGKGGLDGWAIGGCINNPALYMYGIRELVRNKEFSKSKQTWLHIFGTSSFENMLYLSVVQKCLNKLGCNIQISYDSSTQCKTSKYGEFMETQPNLSKFIGGEGLPVQFNGFCESIDKFRMTKLSKFANQKFIKKNTKLPLPKSPVLNEVVDAKEFFEGNYRGTGKNRSEKLKRKNDAWFMIAVNHNLWMMLEQKELFDNLVFWEDDDLITSSIANELKQNVNIIRHMLTKKELRKKYTYKQQNILQAFNAPIPSEFDNRI